MPHHDITILEPMDDQEIGEQIPIGNKKLRTEMPNQIWDEMSKEITALRAKNVCLQERIETLEEYQTVVEVALKEVERK